MKNIVGTLIMFIVVITSTQTVSDQSKNMVEQSGCCSYHRGECGCIGNRVQCCNGSLSPSCRC